MMMRLFRRGLLPLQRAARGILSAAAVVAMVLPPRAFAEPLASQAVVYKVQGPNDRLELVVNSSRILTLDQKVPQVQAANPDVVELTPLSANQVQVLAKKPGVTQVNLWDEQQKIHTIDIIVFPDARELSMLLQSQFPTTSLKVVPTANSVIISGHVDDANQISRIVQIAEDFYPKVINNITIAGAQQILLKVKVMEVDRTKLRKLGIDLRTTGTNANNFFQSGISGLLTYSATGGTGGITPALLTPTDALQLSFGVLSPDNPFFGFINALRKQQMASILAEPNLVAYNGRPASFLSGGQFPITVPQSLGTVSIQYKNYGVQVEFVPLVLGNGAIRLEVNPIVSEIDDTRSVFVNGNNVPALKVNQANTGVEMKAGQTLALAGLVLHERNHETRSVPWFGELPYVGALFRNVKAQDHEVELLILVTPELIEAMDSCQVPPGGPGLSTSTPNDKQLYLKGFIEVPRCPADDACAASRSPGSAYEYGRSPTAVPTLMGPPGPGMGGDEIDVPPTPEAVPAKPTPKDASSNQPATAQVKPPSRDVKVTDRPKAPPGIAKVPGTAPATQSARTSAPAPVAAVPARSVANAATGPVMPARAAAPAGAAPTVARASDNRAVSYKQDNPSSRTGVAKTGQPQSAPKLIGPVGYDVRQ